MPLKPFLKWAGGKRWLVDRDEFDLPAYSGRYIEPFLGGAAVFFNHQPSEAVLSDANPRLVETYIAVRDDWRTVVRLLGKHHKLHSHDYYYSRRQATPRTSSARAANFIYLNRACWNGLYRLNRKGEFNVPIGTKNWIISEADDFRSTAVALEKATILARDFELAIDDADTGDLVFANPPYTVAHNMNGFVKYNENMFSWSDQIRLRDSIARAMSRGATVVMTNADHPSVQHLYGQLADPKIVSRHSVIAGSSPHRRATSEALYVFR